VKSLSGDCAPLISPGEENRLVGLDALNSNVSGVAKQSLRFKYDHQGRRISKTVSNYTGSAWSLSYSTKFIYDGWNLLAEINATNNVLLRSYVWGSDASGTPQGAGRVGGLLAVHDSSGSSITNCFFAYDGNYNVRSLANSKDGTSVAEYEYDPFGNLLKAGGASANANPIRFSTKFQDQETGSHYYGYRSLADGRWLSRDPIDEDGGIALTTFVANDAQNGIDYLGECGSRICPDVCGYAQRNNLCPSDDGSPAYGCVVCCGGRKYACVFRPGTTTPGTRAAEIAEKCERAHEVNHLDKVSCSLGTGRTPAGAEYPSYGAMVAAECSAYLTQLQCLKGGRKDCGGDQNCNRDIDWEISRVERQILKFCPSTQPPKKPKQKGPTP